MSHILPRDQSAELQSFAGQVVAVQVPEHWHNWKSRKALGPRKAVPSLRADVDRVRHSVLVREQMKQL